MFIDQSHAHGGSAKPRAAYNSAKSSANNHDMRMFQSTHDFSRSDLQFGSDIRHSHSPPWLSKKFLQPLVR